MERLKTLIIDLMLKLKHATRAKILKILLISDLATPQSKTMKEVGGEKK